MAVRIANPFPIVVACAVAYVAAFAGLLLAPMAAPMLWVALLGLGPSTFPLSLTLINLRTRTPAGSARLSGFMQGVGYSLSCLGPLLFGWLHDVVARLDLAIRLPAACACWCCCSAAGWRAVRACSRTPGRGPALAIDRMHRRDRTGETAVAVFTG